MSKIVLEDFREGNGYYKINLAYLSKEQVEEIEALVSKWKSTELQKSKDERIREAQLDYWRSVGGKEWHGVPVQETIAWLEKQGEQINLPQFTFGDVIALQCCMETVEDEELYQQLQSLHDRLHDSAYWMGKQNNKPQDKTAFETIREEKDNSNKVEPQFNVGDWLVENEPNNYARFIQILEVVSIYGKEKYKISRDLHNDEDVVEYRFIENNYHPFTIQDAKEGDVLTDNLDWFDNPFIFILKRFENVYFGLPKPSDFSSHCFLTMSDEQEFREGDYHHMHNICPATKEQRNLLFSKMKESNYEWDVEKKKLSEIKPKWTEEDEDMVESIIDYLKPMPIFFESTNGKSGKEYTKEFIKRSIKWLKLIKQRMNE